jgi:hypothetical protein
MNPKDAREVLGVSRDCSSAELNKRYRILALRLHPDKNGNTPEATAAFQELNAAYRMLSDKPNAFNASDKSDDNDDVVEETATYSDIFMHFIKSLFRKTGHFKKEETGPILLNLLHRIVNDYASVSVNAALDSLDPSVLFQLYETLEQYNAAIRMDSGIFEEVTRILREKMQKNNIIILKPSLKDVIQNNISVLKVEGHTFYVPLWHSELHYRIDPDPTNADADSGKQLVVKCMPDLPPHMSIDANNELHVDVRADIKELLNSSGEALRIPLYDSECLELPVRDLRIVARQTLQLPNHKHGISLICATDIYEARSKAPICVHVHMV